MTSATASLRSRGPSGRPSRRPCRVSAAEAFPRSRQTQIVRKACLGFRPAACGVRKLASRGDAVFMEGVSRGDHGARRVFGAADRTSLRPRTVGSGGERSGARCRWTVDGSAQPAHPRAFKPNLRTSTRPSSTYTRPRAEAQPPHLRARRRGRHPSNATPFHLHRAELAGDEIVVADQFFNVVEAVRHIDRGVYATLIVRPK